jgi:hypothetical protein
MYDARHLELELNLNQLLGLQISYSYTPLFSRYGITFRDQIDPALKYFCAAPSTSGDNATPQLDYHCIQRLIIH